MARGPSPFLKVSCAACSHAQIVYSRAASKVLCHECGATLAEPTGGRAKMHGEVLETLT